MKLPIKFSLDELDHSIFRAIHKLEGGKPAVVAERLFLRGIMKWQEENPDWRERFATLQQAITEQMTR